MQEIQRERVRLIRARQGLQARRKTRYPGKSKPLLQAAWPNHVWTYDFVTDATVDGRRLKCLMVCDEFTRQGLRIKVARLLGAAEVKRVLGRCALPSTAAQRTSGATTARSSSPRR
ncbi:MAG: hypothetical protein L0H63_12615 [Nitrococcus sp.]|nr:hypothetical protein [Nitrococcus sp.]